MYRTKSVVTAGVAFAALVSSAACQRSEPAEQTAATLDVGAAYVGISAETPTGSESISMVGLVAAYDMESTIADGRLRDFSGAGHHGTFETASVVDGAYGGARLYRDVADRVHLVETAAFDLDGPLTIAAWVRVDEIGLHQHIFACDDKFALWITPDDRFRLGDTRGGGWSMAEGSVRAGRWTSVVAVLKGTSGDLLSPDVVELWVDGELADASLHQRTTEALQLGAWNPGDLYPADACYIGFESHQGMESHKTLPFVRAIDELLLFDRAWSADEVRTFGGVTGLGLLVFLLS